MKAKSFFILIFAFLAVNVYASESQNSNAHPKLTCRQKVLMGIRHSETMCLATGRMNCQFTKKQKDERVRRICRVANRSW